MIRIPFLLAILWLLNHSIQGQADLITFGSNWKYYDLAHEPADQGSHAWIDIDFNDQLWSDGPAQLGYGDGDEMQTIGDTTLTAYFGHTFNVANPNDFASIDISLLYDDGAVVYLNGAEIWRVNMPNGPIDYNTFAASGSSDNSLASSNFSEPLMSGNNLIAVEVHQRSAGSSDISFDLELVATPLGFVGMARGPYLQKMSDSSVTIKWRTSTPTSSQVRFGSSISNLNQVQYDPTAKIDHGLTIGGLLPGQVIYYQIENDTMVILPAAEDLYVKIGPGKGARQAITTWVLGDCGTKDDNARSVRDAYYNYIGAAHTDLILFLGDNAYSIGTDQEYQLALFENMYEDKLKNTVSWSCLGNHDGATAQSSTQTGPYYDIFSFPTQGECGGISSNTEAYYSFDYGNVHFISLDSYDSPRSVGGAMYNWCENDLQNTMADWIVAFWHHPPYTKGSHDSDLEGRLVDMRENFLPLLESYGVDLVLAGHSHSYERTFYIHGHYGPSASFDTMVHTVGATGAGDGRVTGDGAYSRGLLDTNGAVYVTTGSAGKISNGTFDHEAMYYDIRALGSCVLEVHGGEMVLKFINSSGAIDDHFTIAKDLGCTVGAACDDADICTINDSINAACQCVGDPIANPPAELTLTSADSPLDQTFKAVQSIFTNDQILISPGSLVSLIAPTVQINPSFEVVSTSEFQVMQSGCQ